MFCKKALTNEVASDITAIIQLIAVVKNHSFRRETIDYYRRYFEFGDVFTIPHREENQNCRELLFTNSKHGGGSSRPSQWCKRIGKFTRLLTANRTDNR